MQMQVLIHVRGGVYGERDAGLDHAVDPGK